MTQAHRTAGSNMDQKLAAALGLIAISAVIVLATLAVAAYKANRDKQYSSGVRPEPSFGEKLDAAASARRAGSPRSSGDSAAYWAPVVGGTSVADSGSSSSCNSGGGGG